MKKIILIALCLLYIVGAASAYQLYLRCPESVQVGLPLNCSVDSNFPAGTIFYFVFYQSSSYTTTPLSRQTVTIQENHDTIYRVIDTKGLPGGQYKVEALLSRAEEEKLSSDSMTWQLPKLIDRSGDITITSPMSQTLKEALRIEGSITKAGNEGVEIEVRGPDGVIFGPQWIDTILHIQDGVGEFTKLVTVTQPGEYDVTFRYAKGYVGVKTFKVVAAATPVQTAVPTTAATTPPSTTVPTSSPTTTQSPLSPITIVAALSIIGLISVIIYKHR
ncbi:MAG: hypothetical protein LUQ04_10560 [Methanoregula sp.]|nr:hypothetical protein [Methanoregula sp.]